MEIVLGMREAAAIALAAVGHEGLRSSMCLQGALLALIPSQLLTMLANDPTQFSQAIHSSTYDPLLIWNETTLGELRAVVVSLCKRCGGCSNVAEAGSTVVKAAAVAAQAEVAAEAQAFEFPSLQSEVCVEGVYIRPFLQPIKSATTASATTATTARGLSLPRPGAFASGVLSRLEELVPVASVGPGEARKEMVLLLRATSRMAYLKGGSATVMNAIQHRFATNMPRLLPQLLMHCGEAVCAHTMRAMWVTLSGSDRGAAQPQTQQQQQQQQQQKKQKQKKQQQEKGQEQQEQEQGGLFGWGSAVVAVATSVASTVATTIAEGFGSGVHSHIETAIRAGAIGSLLHLIGDEMGLRRTQLLDGALVLLHLFLQRGQRVAAAAFQRDGGLALLLWGVFEPPTTTTTTTTTTATGTTTAASGADDNGIGMMIQRRFARVLATACSYNTDLQGILCARIPSHIANLICKCGDGAIACIMSDVHSPVLMWTEEQRESCASWAKSTWHQLQFNDGRATCAESDPVNEELFGLCAGGVYIHQLVQQPGYPLSPSQRREMVLDIGNRALLQGEAREEVLMAICAAARGDESRIAETLPPVAVGNVLVAAIEANTSSAAVLSDVIATVTTLAAVSAEVDAGVSDVLVRMSGLLPQLMQMFKSVSTDAKLQALVGWLFALLLCCSCSSAETLVQSLQDGGVIRTAMDTLKHSQQQQQQESEAAMKAMACKALLYAAVSQPNAGEAVRQAMTRAGVLLTGQKVNVPRVGDIRAAVVRIVSPPTPVPALQLPTGTAVSELPVPLVLCRDDMEPEPATVNAIAATTTAAAAAAGVVGDVKRSAPSDTMAAAAAAAATAASKQMVAPARPPPPPTRSATAKQHQQQQQQMKQPPPPPPPKTATATAATSARPPPSLPPRASTGSKAYQQSNQQQKQTRPPLPPPAAACASNTTTTTTAARSPAPPPPPPPIRSASRSKPPPPPPPPRQVGRPTATTTTTGATTGSASGGGGGAPARSGLLAQIQAGKRLKKVAEEEKAHLAASTASGTATGATGGGGGGGLMGALAEAMAKRRQSVRPIPQDDSSDQSEDEWS